MSDKPTPRTDAAVHRTVRCRQFLCSHAKCLRIDELTSSRINQLETELAEARGLLERLYGHWTDQGFTDDVIGEEIQQFLSRGK